MRKTGRETIGALMAQTKNTNMNESGNNSTVIKYTVLMSSAIVDRTVKNFN